MSRPRPRWSEGLRWATCFVLVLGLHAGAAASLLARWQPADEPVAGGPPILIDLAPVAAAPEAPQSEAAPGPTQVETPPDPAPADKPDQDKPQVTADVTPKEEPPPDRVEPLAPAVETPPVPETRPIVADVVLPPPKPRLPPAEPKHHRRVANLNSAPPTAERQASRPMAPAPVAAAHDPNAIPHWKSELVARLERYKRYPGEAQARGEEGVAQLGFSVDRAGGVHNARIVRSSGSTLLDRATLDLIARAQPLPPPPAEMRAGQVAIVVPINYNLRGAR